MNLVILDGNIVRDAEVRYTKNGKAVTSFTVATNKTYVVNGEEKQRTSYINCVAWGKLADKASALRKGDKAVVKGSINTGSYEKDGRKVYTFDVNVEFLSIDGKGDSTPSNFDNFGQQDDYPF